MDGRTIIRQAVDRLYADVGEEAVLLGGDHYVGLNSAGKAIWHRIALPVALADLVHDLAGTDDAPITAIEHELTAFLATLRAQDLIEVTAPAPAAG